METVFRLSNCTMENQIKFATCTLLGRALIWWNSHVRTVGHDVAYAITWTNLKKKMSDMYCTRARCGHSLYPGPGERKEYAGTLSLCNKCKFYHNDQCKNCKRVGHLTRDCRSPAATNNQRNLTCYECRNQGHYRSDCPELKNQNHRNQVRARGMAHALGGGETNQDLNNIEDDINA
uniref:Reverse transcriptase domain-containing protein n=1 Tax=Tanacetum cinerariifolium TaxID=118510 RepID=A0A6L2LT33_TANCI|nr:reverse transcriptase domain-containing protein [Tanacetum cinerariifolium]